MEKIREEMAQEEEEDWLSWAKKKN
jgi:hypothetical protein